VASAIRRAGLKAQGRVVVERAYSTLERALPLRPALIEIAVVDAGGRAIPHLLSWSSSAARRRVNRYSHIFGEYSRWRK